MKMDFAADLRFSSRLGAKSKGAWLVTVDGASYSKLLDAWGRRDLTIDEANDQYWERIVLFDGTVIESKAKLSDHRAGFQTRVRRLRTPP